MLKYTKISLLLAAYIPFICYYQFGEKYDWVNGCIKRPEYEQIINYIGVLLLFGFYIDYSVELIKMCKLSNKKNNKQHNKMSD